MLVYACWLSLLTSIAAFAHQAEMNDVLKVARRAREAGEIYADEKHFAMTAKATKDVYLVDMISFAHDHFWLLFLIRARLMH